MLISTHPPEVSEPQTEIILNLRGALWCFERVQHYPCVGGFDHNSAQEFVQVGCGLSVVIFSTQLLTNFFGFSGALV